MPVASIRNPKKSTFGVPKQHFEAFFLEVKENF